MFGRFWTLGQGSFSCGIEDETAIKRHVQTQRCPRCPFYYETPRGCRVVKWRVTSCGSHEIISYTPWGGRQARAPIKQRLARWVIVPYMYNNPPGVYRRPRFGRRGGNSSPLLFGSQPALAREFTHIGRRCHGARHGAAGHASRERHGSVTGGRRVWSL